MADGYKPADSDLVEVVNRILDESLAIQPGERFLFFTDFNSPFEERFQQLVARRRFLHEFFEAFLAVSKVRSRGVGDKCESTRTHGGEPGESIWRQAFGQNTYRELIEEDLLWKLKGEVELTRDEEQWLDEVLRRNAEDTVDAVIAFPWYSVTHTRFTRLLTARGCRFASMPMLTPGVLGGPMRASWEDVAARTRAVHEVLVKTAKLQLTCSRGTDLSLRPAGRELIHQDTGLLRSKGALGNLPAGEAYFVPYPKSAEGTLVLTSGPDRPQVEPTKLVIERGKVAYIGLSCSSGG